MADGLLPPYPVIYKGLLAGTVIPFLGAGAPLYGRDPRVTSWRAGPSMPLATELAEHLASETLLPPGERGELTKMAQYYEAEVGSGPLRKLLSEIFSHEQPPTPLHDFLAGLPKPSLIVTTNYDDLLERAFQKAGKPFDRVVHATNEEKVLWWPHGSADPQAFLSNELLVDLDKVSVIYKMHGAIDRRRAQVGQYVITEDDYTKFLTRMTRKTAIPDIFAEPFQNRPFLFLGYGLYDWNMRVILNHLQEFGGTRIKSWAIETLKKPVERKLWEARGVNVYDGLPLDQFLTELQQKGGGKAP